jgi:GGDEF domain-containing protein
MAELEIEHQLLKRALTDPATGLPNTLYLELIRNWQAAVAERHGGSARVIALAVSGGTDDARRKLAWSLAEAVRKSDLLASEGRERFFLLLALHDDSDLDAVRARVDDVVNSLNAKMPGEPQLNVVVSAVTEDSASSASTSGDAPRQTR